MQAGGPGERHDGQRALQAVDAPDCLEQVLVGKALQVLLLQGCISHVSVRCSCLLLGDNNQAAVMMGQLI